MKTLQEIVKFLEDHVVECDLHTGCGKCDEGRACIESINLMFQSAPCRLTKEKIIKILQKRVKNLIGDDLISPLFWEDFANDLLNANKTEDKI